MKLGSKIKLFLICLITWVFFGWSSVLGKEKSFVTVVNPIRGEEFWGLKNGRPLDGVEIEKNILTKEGVKGTWLLRYDAIASKEIINLLKSDSGGDELGIFMEITPDLAKAAQVSFPAGGIFWHDANKIFLSGYKPEDRVRLIDALMEKFRLTFGYYPKSVGAWHVDSFSAGYMEKKYSISSVLLCADQFGTDGYQIWGGWWGVPYFPSKWNILLPAQTEENKLNLVVFWWAARDPELGYGGSVSESTYSIQANDYISHGKGIEYFGKLLDFYLENQTNKFGQLTIGLENDNNWEKIGTAYEKQIKEIKNRIDLEKIQVVTMSEFSNWYKNKFVISPDHYIGGWLMSSKFRIGLLKEDGQTVIRDLRIYNDNWPESNLLTANPWPDLSLEVPAKIDTVRNSSEEKKIDFEISYQNLVKRFGKQEIPFKTKTHLVIAFYFFLILIIIFSFRNNFSLLSLMILGTICLSFPLVKSGLLYPFGMGFWGPNGHDGIWHLALINQLAKFNFTNPVFSGVRLSNYHFGYDLMVAAVHKVTGISALNLYFQLLPPILSILIGWLTYKFVYEWRKSKTSALLAVFFVYFGGSLGWLITFLRDKSFGGESLFWANQSISTLVNPPYALSLVILLVGLLKFLHYLEKPNWKNLFIVCFLFGILLQIKVYAGIIVLGSLFALMVSSLVVQTIELKVVGNVFWGSLLVALTVFLPFNLKSGSLLVFSPLWFPHTMLAFQDRFFWPRLENARLVYLTTGNWLKLVPAETLALVIFLLGNLGTRVFGIVVLFGWLKNVKKLFGIEFLFLIMTAISLVFPLLFIQKGNPWNTIQFFYYFQFFLAILTGIFLGKSLELNSKKKSSTNRILICAKVAAVILLTLPTSLITLKNDYLPGRPPSRVSVSELEALNYLKNLPEGIILSYPFQQEWRNFFPEPKPLYAYETTAYVSAFTEKQSYLADEMNLEISGYSWRERREQSVEFFRSKNQSWGKNFLNKNNISYIYLVKGQKMEFGERDIDFKKIFENGEVKIFQKI